MAITVPGSGSSATTSVTIPAHAVGDMIVIMARGTVAPTAPAAGGTVPTWTTPTNQTGVNNSIGWRLGYAIATATTHTSGTWTNAAQMHVLVLHPSAGTLGIGNDPAQGGANNTQTMIYPAWTHTAGKLANLVIRYGARGTADTEVRTDGAFAASGVWATEQPATTPTSAVFTKVVTASEGTFTATPAGVNAAYRCGTVEITETAAPTVYSKAADITLTPAIASVATFFSVFEAAASVALTPAVASAGHKIVERSASITLTPDVASDGEFETPGGFSPPDIAGLYAWYDADQLGLANNDPVSSWTDESGGARHATGAVTPLYKTGIQNGLPGVLFDGTDDTLAMTFSADASRTFFIVAQSSVSGAATRAAFGGASGRSLVQISGTWRWTRNQAPAIVNLGGTSTNTTVLSGVLTSASAMDWYLDTGSATSFDPDDTVTTGTGWTIGSYASGQYWSGYIFEIVVYDSALGTTDRESVRDYLISKWTAAAPTVHERSASITLTPDVAAAGHEGFFVTDIPGLECWLKADAIGLSDGANVTTWEDSHTSNKDATGATGQTYETGEINGLPVVRFDGTDDKLVVSGITGNDATRTIFVVARILTATAGEAVWGIGANATLAMAGTGNYRWTANQAGTNVDLGGGPVNTTRIVTVRFNSTSSADGYLDSGAATNFDPNDTYQSTATAFALASRTAAGTQFGNVEIGELLVFDSALVDADLDDVRDYLINKWTVAAPTVYERSASITLTPDIASAQQNFSVLERSASVTLTPAIASVPQRVRLRSASVTITPAIASSATFYSILARSAAVAITPAIATAPQRVLMRATAVTITPAVIAAGQIEGGLVVHERSASITLTPAVASSATFYSIIERSASVTITPVIASAQMRVVMRQASVTLTPAIASSGAILQIWSRSATVTITPSISAAGFAGDLFETHPPLTVEVRDALLTVIHDEGDTSIIFDSSESTVIYDETTTDVSVEGDREAAVPEHLTSVDVAEPVLTVDYDEIPRTVEVA